MEIRLNQSFMIMRQDIVCKHARGCKQLKCLLICVPHTVISLQSPASHDEVLLDLAAEGVSPWPAWEVVFRVLSTFRAEAWQSSTCSPSEGLFSIFLAFFFSLGQSSSVVSADRRWAVLDAAASSGGYRRVRVNWRDAFVLTVTVRTIFSPEAENDVLDDEC